MAKNSQAQPFLLLHSPILCWAHKTPSRDTAYQFENWSQEQLRASTAGWRTRTTVARAAPQNHHSRYRL
jgi:transposase